MVAGITLNLEQKTLVLKERSYMNDWALEK